MKVLTIALHKNDQPVSASFELLGAAKSISKEIFTVFLAGSADPGAKELASRGGGKVIPVSNALFKYFNEELYASVISGLIKKYQPQVVLAPASLSGKALLSRLAALNGGSMASEAIGLTVDGGSVVVTRSHYGGSVVSKVTNNGSSPFFVSVRLKIFPESKDGSGEVVNESIDPSNLAAKSKVLESKVESAGEVSLTEADVIVSAGRGMKGPEHVPLVQELAKSLQGAFGASRAIVDAGWVPYSHQVGQTGKTVNPKLYIAVGISGAIQHLVGMRTSGTIVAVNKDKDAPIFNVANYGIVGDAFEIVPALTAKFKKELHG
ncbi:MAG TPA: electron transfer flavoprotein subunit alpha/FixB family protein [candidate division Zixibacteria bacterium]|nr:electron transfer flavoprotein subunit alpha/FixB family protein [candidate division Zixibacteria bacterium]